MVIPNARRTLTLTVRPNTTPRTTELNPESGAPAEAANPAPTPAAAPLRVVDPPPSSELDPDTRPVVHYTSPPRKVI
jgi:hypothetical protein